ncbi:MAG TPA: hypothetical protein VK864_14755 [Longimicrobiales bacterium]|nr:hypothetical protein [Longimicrobiales bacterium]
MADLLFTARLRAAASAAAAELVFASTPAEVIALAREHNPRLLIVDLDTRALDPVGLIADCKEEPSTRDIPILAFVSHVREDAIAAARAAGAEQVMARGAFVKNLAHILTLA